MKLTDSNLPQLFDNAPPLKKLSLSGITFKGCNVGIFAGLVKIQTLTSLNLSIVNLLTNPYKKIEEEVKEQLFDPAVLNTSVKKLKIRVRSTGARKFPLKSIWYDFISKFVGVSSLTFSGVNFQDAFGFFIPELLLQTPVKSLML